MVRANNYCAADAGATGRRRGDLAARVRDMRYDLSRRRLIMRTGARSIDSIVNMDVTDGCMVELCGEFFEA